MRSCYLDDRHPALLIQALDATASFIPLEMRRKTFRTLLQTALSPLSQLQTSPDGIYARIIKKNLRGLLGSGQGLPLLFPRHELDFSYDESKRNNTDDSETEDWSKDSIASSPRLALGELFPHIVVSVPLETLRRFPRLQPVEDDEIIHENFDDLFTASVLGETSRKISTRDLGAQLTTNKGPLSFCLLEIVGCTNDTTNIYNAIEVDNTLSSIKMTLEGKFGIRFTTSRLTVYSNCDGDVIQLDRLDYEEKANATICDMYVGSRQWGALNLFPALPETSSSTKFVVIRPDGHVAGISSKGTHGNNLISEIQTILIGR